LTMKASNMNLVTILKSKIHRATVTEADLDYVGSITLDPVLMAAAGILDNEKVLVADITNGSRLETYAIRGQGRPGEICINGAAARMINVGDLVLIMTFRTVEEAEGPKYPPAVVFVDENNAVTSIRRDEP